MEIDRFDTLTARKELTLYIESHVSTGLGISFVLDCGRNSEQDQERASRVKAVALPVLSQNNHDQL
jgi:hypothetical protein